MPKELPRSSQGAPKESQATAGGAQGPHMEPQGLPRGPQGPPGLRFLDVSSYLPVFPLHLSGIPLCFLGFLWHYLISLPLGSTVGTYRWDLPLGPTVGTSRWDLPTGPTPGTYPWDLPLGPAGLFLHFSGIPLLFLGVLWRRLSFQKCS